MMTNSTKDVSDVLYALALAMPVPDAKTLDEFVRRYPQHAEALTEFAVQLALDPGPYGDEDGDETQDGAVSPAVSRAISHFQNVSFELEKKGGPMRVDDIVAALRQRAAEHRANGWELMREGDPALLERAAKSLELWKSVADVREEQARINHQAYASLSRRCGGSIE